MDALLVRSCSLFIWPQLSHVEAAVIWSSLSDLEILASLLLSFRVFQWCWVIQEPYINPLVHLAHHSILCTLAWIQYHQLHYCYSNFHHYLPFYPSAKLIILIGYEPRSQYLKPHYRTPHCRWNDTLHYTTESIEWPHPISPQMNTTLPNRVEYLSLRETTMPHLYNLIQ